MAGTDWKVRLERFFHNQAAAIDGVPTLLDHCSISGKEPRLSSRPEVHLDLIESIERALTLDRSSVVLEVGCASGYVACGLAPRVYKYTGVDLSVAVLAVARRMELTNSEFINADGEALPFEGDSFDAAFANDVVLNFPKFENCVPLIREMLRVVKPGGRVMVGAVTDKSKAVEFQERVREYSKQLDLEYGPAPQAKNPTADSKAAPDVKPEAVFYYYDCGDFFEFARSEGIDIRMEHVHELNPYTNFRYNFIYIKPSA
jgi:ubiquinone/menaquinone biosynthesis C-methylase UbiE